MKANSRDGQRQVANTLARKLGYHINFRRARKLQCQAAVCAMLNQWKVEQLPNGDIRMKRR